MRFCQVVASGLQAPRFVHRHLLSKSLLQALPAAHEARMQHGRSQAWKAPVPCPFAA